jgi:hypothetical protein
MDMLAQASDIWNRIGELSRGLGEHLPKDLGVAAVWPLILLLVASVFIGLYGERLTRALVLGTFIGLAALAGRWLADSMVLPLWPTVLLTAALGGILAHLFYRWSLGLALAVVLAVAAAAWSTGSSLDTNDLRGALSDLSAVVGAGETPAPTPGEAAGPMPYVERVWRQVMRVWSAAAARPEAQKHLLVTMLAGAAIGLFAGLVLGRFAAILLSSVLAAGGLLLAGISLAVWHQPQWGDYLSNNRQYVLMAGVAAALVFMLRQLARGHSAVAAVAVAPAVAPSSNKS